MRILLEIPEDLGYRALMDPEDVVKWLKSVIVDGLMIPDDREVLVKAVARCADCGEPMETLVRAHHHTENGVDVTSDRRCITRANGDGPRCTRRAGHDGDHRTYKGETW